MRLCLNEDMQQGKARGVCASMQVDRLSCDTIPPNQPQEVRRHETFMPETTGMVPSKQRVLDKEEGSGGDVCAHLYQEGMAALERYASCAVLSFPRSFVPLLLCLLD